MVLTSGRRTHLTVSVTAALPVLLLAACGGDDAAGSPEDPYVVATTGIWADVTARVACDDSLAVRTIVPAGGDPHAYEPSLRDREVLDGAALVVANGLDLEESLVDTLDAAESAGVPVFSMSDHVTLTDDADPHIWFDPTRVRAALPALGDALVEAGADGAAIGDCVTAAQAELEALDAELASMLARVPAERRVLVTNHDNLGYFADRYDFRIIGSVLPSTSTLTAASPGELEDLRAEIEAAGVPAIFTESFADREDADALAAGVGADVVELYTDALGEPGSGADTYDALLRFDAAAIARALGGGSPAED